MHLTHKWAVILCNSQYVVQSVLQSQNLVLNLYVGDHISKLILPSDLHRFLEMTKKLDDQVSDFGYEMTVRLANDHPQTMQFGAFTSEQGFYILLYSHYLLLYDDLISINNEQTNLIRSKMKQAREGPFYLDQLSIINNDMVNLQRDLYKKNVEIEKLLLFQENLNKQLKSTIELKNQIIGVIGHDLKGPLGNIIWFLELISESYKNSGTDPSMTHLSINMTTSAQLMLTTLQNLIFWSKIQMADITCNFTSTDLNELIESVVSFEETEITKKNIHISVDGRVPDFIEMDKTLLETILRNLLSNAIKFSQPGKNIWIRVYHRHENEGTNTLIFEVEDEGAGMNQEQLKLATSGMIGFSTKGTDGEKGTGLGLAICKSLVHLLSGQMTILSTEGKGTCVQVKIRH